MVQQEVISRQDFPVLATLELSNVNMTKRLIFVKTETDVRTLAKF